MTIKSHLDEVKKNILKETTEISESKENKGVGKVITSYEKFLMVLETASLADQELKEYCIKKGIALEDINRWVSQCVKAMESNAEERELSKSILISNLPGMVYRCKYDKDWTMEFVSDGSLGLTGYPPESLIANKELSFNDVIISEYRGLLFKEWERVVIKGIPFKYEYEIRTASGDRKWVTEFGEGVYNENGELEALEGIILDISDRKESEDKLKYFSEHDIWTGLYNRRYLEKILRNDAIAETPEKRALVKINLGTVHLVNLTYGFQYSQELIKKATDTLSGLCTSNLQLFSTDTNRLMFYVKAYQDKSEIIDLCESIISSLESVLVGERTGGGIGVVEIDEDNKDGIECLMRNLLVASEEAIATFDREFGFCFYDLDMESRKIREETIHQELAEIALGENNDRLYLEFQPILDLKSNKICGFEALARLHSSNLGQVHPLEFIPIAEKTKLIIPLGEIIIIRALEFLNRINKNGHDTVRVSINISAIQLLRHDFAENLFNRIKEMEINPHNVGLEITESIFASNYDEINRILGELKNIGIKIFIDDFGTEYSSLARVRELNVNCLKMDKYFADNLLLLDENEVITADIISMSHKLGYSVIAEGVEDEKQRQYLEAHGCDRIQGYLISKPLKDNVAIELINKQRETNTNCYFDNSLYT